MSGFDNPFDPNVTLKGGCSCGRHRSQAEHDQANAHPAGDEDALGRAVESTLVRALFPSDQGRRNFLRAVGSGTALAALSSLFPLGAAKALAAEGAGPLEKKDLKIGFLPILVPRPSSPPIPWASTRSRG